MYFPRRIYEFQSNSDNFIRVLPQRFLVTLLSKNVAVFDVRHQFKVDATYDLPFGKGKRFSRSPVGKWISWRMDDVAGDTLGKAVRLLFW